MRSNLLSVLVMNLFALVLLSAAPLPLKAQEGELQVVDEVIAQVNDDVITLSMLKRESKERVESLKQSGMSEQQASDEVAKRQAELIATLVNEQLLLQKGKELELSNEVEAEVNRRMLEVAKEQGINSIEKLNEAMIASHLDPSATRQTLRTEIMKQAVVQQDVDRKLFFGFTPDEVKKYFEAHRDKFRKPESVTISEIFLSRAGKNEADVKARAMELVTQLRAGADFAALATANSEREVDGRRLAPETKGKVGAFEVPNLREDIAGAIKNVKVGGVSDPLSSGDGFQILRVDERTPGSDVAVFNENQVREAMTMERSPKARDEYMQTLRNEAYVKISESYSAQVMPLLKLTPPAAAKTDESAGDKKSKKNSKKP